VNMQVASHETFVTDAHYKRVTRPRTSCKSATYN
jgi:hypothetical protein